ncbi:Conserved_hypothetical protein [Hexamita inflata]|uniref:t-SNARE coiled-coil homology domain-containing protein n=1 Tax=Hexamita inflata TaxID=28002 RepID=A0AA86TL15_9EUKA|nr:Conserved hypothetical protein [Hexamita inflata]CAI9945353.1 Conserved hypothetical protein [Hexamita inflata]
MQNITDDILQHIIPLAQQPAQIKTNKIHQIYQQLQRVLKQTKSMEPTPEFTNKVTKTIQEANIFLNSHKPDNNIGNVIFAQQKQIMLQHIFQLNEYVQLQMKRQSMYQNQFEIQHNQLESIEMSQQLVVKEKQDSSFNRVVNTLQEIAVLQKRVAEEVQKGDQDIYKIGQNVETAEVYVDKANKHLGKAIKNIIGRQKCLVKLFIIVIAWMIVKNVIKLVFKRK